MSVWLAVSRFLRDWRGGFYDSDVVPHVRPITRKNIREDLSAGFSFIAFVAPNFGYSLSDRCLQQPHPRVVLWMNQQKNVEEYVQLRSVLSAEKAQIEERLRQIRDALGEPAAGSSSTSSPPGKRPGGFRTPIGQPTEYKGLRELIVNELQRVGEHGIHIEDLARAVGNNVSNVRVWFYSKAARQFRNIRKVARATYGWKH